MPAKKKVPGSPAARLPHILHPWGGVLILTSDKFMDKPFTCVVLMVQVCVYVFYCLKNSFADYATLVTGSTSVKEFLVPVISVVLVITGLASIRVIIIA